MSRERVTIEERIMAARACAEGCLSQAEAARRLGIDKSTVCEWVQRYQVGGASAFQKQEHNAVYHSKLSSAEAMLTGLGLVHPNPENG